MSHRFAIFGDGAARDIDAVGSQQRDDAVVGENLRRLLVLDHLADAVAHGFGRVRLGAVNRLNRGGEKIFQLEQRRAASKCICST